MAGFDTSLRSLLVDALDRLKACRSRPSHARCHLDVTKYSNRVTRSRLPSLVLLAMAWAKGGNAGSDKKSGVVAVQIGLCHHVVRDVTRLQTVIKFIADLTTSGGRSLPGREGDAPGRERAVEIAAVDRVVSVRGRGRYSYDTKWRDNQDKAGDERSQRAERTHLGGGERGGRLVH